MTDEDLKKWFFDFESATAEAQKQRKPILLQFHREKCSGCRKMYAVTYPNATVRAELYDWFVPLRLDILKDRRIRSQYAAVWTPSFYFLDHRGKMYHNIPGYLPPDDFRILLRLGLAAYYIPRGKYDDAIAILSDGLDKFPNHPRASAMMFQRGMAHYLKTYDNKRFRAEMTELRNAYPKSAEARMWPWMEE